MKYFGFLLTTLLLLTSVFPATPVMAQESKLDRAITVSGEGVVQAIPDKATVRFGIVTRHEDPEMARTENASTSKETLNAVRDLGVDQRKIRMETLRLQPVREYNPETRRPEDKGYEAARELVVEIVDLDILPNLIAKVVQHGANRLNGVTYGIQDREAIRDEALVEAVTRARSKALLMAETLNAELGMVMRIAEQSFSMPSPMVRMSDQTMMMAKAEAAPEPEAYAAGEMEVRAIVQVVFQMK